MPGGGDPDNRRDFPGGWIGDTNDAFTASGRAREQQEIFLASDESFYVFARELEEERLVIAFNKADESRALRIALADTPAQNATEISLLFGDAKAELVKKEIQVTMPAQSLSIFTLN